MATTENDLERFSQFVAIWLAAGETEATLDELFDLWRQQNPSDALYRENVAAIAASIEDFTRGIRGSIAGAHSAELRREFGVADK